MTRTADFTPDGVPERHQRGQGGEEGSEGVGIRVRNSWWQFGGIPGGGPISHGGPPRRWRGFLSDIFLHETWAVVREGDRVGEALARLARVRNPRYVLKKSIRVKRAPAIETWRRVAMPIGLPPNP